MLPARGRKLHRKLHPGSPPLRYGGKDSPSCFAPGKVPVSSPRSRLALDRLFEGVARAEGGNLLGRDLHLLAGLGIPAFPGLTLLDRELPEACDLDLLASPERFGHYLLEGLEVLLGLALGRTGLLGDPLDEFLLLHGRSFLWSSSASWRACLVCLLPVYTRAGIPCHPLTPGGFGETEIVGVYRERCTTFGTSTSQSRLGRMIHTPKHCCSRCSMLIGPILSAAPKRGVNSGKEQCRSALG